MIDSSFEVILCYKAHPGKEINDSGGEFPGTSDFISSSYPSASRFLCATDLYLRAPLAARRVAENRKRLERLALPVSSCLMPERIPEKLELSDGVWSLNLEPWIRLDNVAMNRNNVAT